MSFDENWPRWLEASMLQWVDDNKPTGGFVYYEGQERKTNNYSSWFEVRIDGPWSLELSKDFWRIELELNVLCSVGVNRDFHAISRMTGAMAKALDNPIPVMKYGLTSGIDDPNEKLGCLTLNTDNNKRGILIHKYGQIQPKVKLIQATVEARYWINLP